MKKEAEIKIRNGRPQDHEIIVSVMPDWWGGRDLSASVLKIFFIHFQETTFVVEKETQLIGFLVGFLSQSEEKVGYIHFVGVHPAYRKSGIGRLLYQQFYASCTAHHRSIVKSCTSPVNKLSIAFHQRMGFTIAPGDGLVDGISVSLNYLGKNDPKVLFSKDL